MLRFLVVTAALMSGVSGMPDAIHQATFIGRVHVDKSVRNAGRYALRSTVTTVDALRGAPEPERSVLSKDQGFSATAELSLVEGAEQLVFLRKESVDGKDEWVVVEAFLVGKDERLMLGDGSTTWWAANPRPYKEARAELVKAISDDDKLPRTPLPQPKRTPRKDAPDGK